MAIVSIEEISRFCCKLVARNRFVCSSHFIQPIPFGFQTEWEQLTDVRRCFVITGSCTTNNSSSVSVIGIFPPYWIQLNLTERKIRKWERTHASPISIPDIIVQLITDMAYL